MTIKDAFQFYRENNFKFSYRPDFHIYNEFLLEIQKSNNITSEGFIEGVLSFLSHNEDRWFLFHLLTVIDELPDELFIPIMNSILSIGFDNCPTILYDNIARLYGFEKVELYLQDEFTRSYSEIYKKSIVEAMWRISYSIPYIIPDDDLDFITFRKYVWVKNSYQFLEFIPDSQEEAKQMFNNQEILIQNRYRLLLEHFLNHQISPEFFHDCSVVLPRRRAILKDENLKLFDKLVEKLRDIKNNNKSNFSLYLNNPINNWHWI